MSDTTITIAILAYALAVLASGLGYGLSYIVRNELARRRAARMVWPPMETLEVQDEIPF